MKACKYAEWCAQRRDLGELTRDVMLLVVGGGAVAGCALPLTELAGGRRNMRNALAAMRDDTFAPRRIGNLPHAHGQAPAQQDKAANATHDYTNV